MHIMHCLAMELSTRLYRVITASGVGTVVTMPIVIVMIDMSIEMIPSVIPRPRTDKYTAREPFRAIVAIWGAVIRRNLVIAVRAIWRNSDTHRDLCGRTMIRSQ
jgi:hypothetical protein